MHARGKGVLIAIFLAVAMMTICIAGCIGPDGPRNGGGGGDVTTGPTVYDTSHDAMIRRELYCAPSSGTSPLKVYCDARTTGYIDPQSSFDWEFGDGTMREGSDPVVNHTYGKAGTYRIELSVNHVPRSEITITVT